MWGVFLEQRRKPRRFVSWQSKVKLIGMHGFCAMFLPAQTQTPYIMPTTLLAWMRMFAAGFSSTRGKSLLG